MGTQLTDSLKHVTIFQEMSEMLLLPVNLVATMAIFLSTFHCDSCQCSCIHIITSSSFLGILQMISMLSFLGQLFASQFLLAWTGVFYLLDHVCFNHKEDLLQVQGLLANLGEEHGGPWQPSWRFLPLLSPISIQKFEYSMDLTQYCSAALSVEEPAEMSTQHLWLAALLTACSQVALAIALSGERQRAGVHEETTEYMNSMTAGMASLMPQSPKSPSLDSRAGQGLLPQIPSTGPSMEQFLPGVSGNPIFGFKGRQGGY